MVYVFFADGFEEIEALCPVDLLRRAGIGVTTVSVNAVPEATGAHGITVRCDATADSLPDETPELVMLPGGMPGTKNLAADPRVCDFVLRAWRAGAFVAAICAAPSVLGTLGITKGKRAVCYPGFEHMLEGAEIPDARVVRDGKLITAVAMGASTEFALELITALRGEQAAKKIKESVFA